ncbi:MAG: putative MerR-family transcriptional regulator [Frankiales bacterium]|jgi:DNA-binding transcriptional MerR regulator|nr:putative MerR-family transcriptional regulator [Frankiales bacterium]
MVVVEDELTVDQLAERVGMTVRNVRAYAARGLLPPPRLAGRTGLYGPHHVARLTLVRQLLAQGYTLAAVQKAVESEPQTSSAGSLALHRALMAPWLPDATQETDLDELAARAGAEDASGVVEVVDALAAMGVVERIDGHRLRVLDAGLLDAGVRGVRLGLPAGALVAAQQQVVELVEQAAQVYVEMFRSTVWQQFVDAGTPPEGWPQIQSVVEGLEPVAAQALLASFRSAMAAAVAEEVDSQLGGLRPPG